MPFLSLPARNLAPDYSYSRLIHNQGGNLLIKEWNSLLPRQSEWGTKPAALRTLSTERDRALYSKRNLELAGLPFPLQRGHQIPRSTLT